jgi:hypothetical protein
VPNEKLEIGIEVAELALPFAGIDRDVFVFAVLMVGGANAAREIQNI